jgi:oxepin-CoA hydrolase/3-oxo-5,6-dehydrosuberyl-CoA semialdehyde dehydrogenase
MEDEGPGRILIHPEGGRQVRCPARFLEPTMIRLTSYLAGSWFAGSGRHVPLVDPSTEEVIAEASSEGADFAAALEHARNVGGPALRALSFAERAALLKDMAKILHAHREELLDLAQKNGGNTRGDAKFDVDGAIGTLAAYATFGEALAKRVGDRRFLTDGDMFPLTRSPRFVGQHVWVPRTGVAVHINAFNFPAWGTFEKAAVALLAGIPIITKPATATALVTWRMTQVLVESGRMPAGSFQLVVGSTGDLLSRLGPQDHLAFTGSNATGAMLRGTAGFAEKSVRVTVEADSLNAAVAGPDVEPGSDLWNTLVRNIVTDMTQKTGQKCTAVRRVFVPAAHADALQEALVDALANVVVGNPLQDGVTMGPVSTASQLRDALAGIRALAAHATIVTGGAERLDGRGAPEGKGFYVAPTVLRAASATDAGPVHDLEVFGPVVTLLPYDGTASVAAELVALGQGSLVTSAYSDDRAWVETFVLGAAPSLGRLLLLSSKVADQATAPGMVLPALVHGGPGRAGGGEELGGERGLLFYMQRTALQGDSAVIGKLFAAPVPTAS